MILDEEGNWHSGVFLTLFYGELSLFYFSLDLFSLFFVSNLCVSAKIGMCAQMCSRPQRKWKVFSKNQFRKTAGKLLINEIVPPYCFGSLMQEDS